MYVVIIPAYQPDQTLVDVCRGLVAAIPERAWPKVIVVDDGSTEPKSKDVFETLRDMQGLEILVHAKNRGKGAALKTAFAHVLENYPAARCIVTADADGQHRVEDIIRVCDHGLASGQTVFGVRSFGADVPLRSRFGNKLTRTLFKTMLGVDISDTQTGLRAIPRSSLVDLLAIDYDRYNFEFEALIRLVRRGKVLQLPIETVYEPGNPSSHFNPLLDSARIYAVLFRHASLVSLIAVCDIVLFTIMSALGFSVAGALMSSRTVTTVLYFTVAREAVFRSKGNVVRQGLLFLLLVAGNVALLTPFITMANSELGVSKTLAMLVGQTFLYVSNFLWQNYIIFKHDEQDQ